MRVISRRRYLALVALQYPTDPTIIRRLAAGENIPWGQRGHRRVRAGEVVTDIPVASVAGLLAKGRIRLVTDADDDTDTDGTGTEGG